MAAQTVEDTYERVIEPVDPAAVIVTCASGGDKAGCLVTFNGPCSIQPPRYAVWLSHRNHGVSGTDEDKFARVPWSDCAGTPLLHVSGGWVRGRILSRGPGRDETGGDHTCFVLAPVAAGSGGGHSRPLRMSDVQHINPGQPAGG